MTALWRERLASAPLAADALLASALLAALSLGVTTSAELEHADGRLVGALLNAVILAPLVLRRRWPLATLAASGGAAAVVALSFGPTGGEAGVLLALGTFAAREPSTSRVAAVLAAAAAGTAAVALAIEGDTPSTLAGSLFGLVAAAAVGVAVRARQAQLQAVADQAAHEASLAVAAERARIAREVHDVVAHNVSVMVALADGADRIAAAAPERSSEAVRQIAAIGREALDELRELLAVLRGGGDDAGRAPQPDLEELDDLLSRIREAGLPARLRVEGSPVRPGPVTQITLYRIAQEALTNALRHAVEPTGVEVRLTWGREDVALEVVDDGRAASASAAPGRGVTGMRERAALHDAALVAGPRPEGGWKVATRLPLRGGA